MKKRSWRVLVPVLATLGLVAVGVPTVLAGELDDDPDNNRLKVRMTLACNSDSSVTLRWNSRSPRGARSMTAAWYDVTADPDFTAPTPTDKADQLRAVRRRNGKASGAFRITGVPSGHRIALFVDAWSQPGGGGDQVFGLGRNIDTIRC